MGQRSIGWIDLPPIWLAGCLAIAWPLRAEGRGGGLVFDILGWALIAAGLGLMLAAVVEMRRHRTTVIPHLEPDALVRSGVFSISRNPIYLGDVLVLAGAVLALGAWPALMLVPVLAAILQIRFIRPEEGRLRARFGAAFEAYCAGTRRWI